MRKKRGLVVCSGWFLCIVDGRDPWSHTCPHMRPHCRVEGCRQRCRGYECRSTKGKP
jgi:hypothetical protein